MALQQEEQQEEKPTITADEMIENAKNSDVEQVRKLAPLASISEVTLNELMFDIEEHLVIESWSSI